MQRIYSVNRKRCVSAVCFAGLMGAMAVAPGPAFAQAAKNAAEPSSGKTVSKAVGDSASPEKLIVGTWRGGTNSGKITFKADGTYREFPTSLSQGNDPNLPVQQNAQGAWSFDQGELVLSWYADQVVQLPNGEAQPAKVELHGRFKIGRLDGSFLRLVGAADPNNPRVPVIFYRRLGDITPLDSLKDKVSPEVLRVAELAHMDSEEALLLAAWSKTDPRRSPWLALADRATSAANGKLALKELFGFSDAELNAFNKLKDLVGREALWAEGLKSQGLLDADEQSASKKIAAFQNQWKEFYDAVGATMGPLPGGRSGGRGQRRGGQFNPPPAAAPANFSGTQAVAGLATDGENTDDPAQARLRSETFSKLKSLLEQFSIWLSTDALAEPSTTVPPAAGDHS
jgi:hypothetical protein